MKNNQNSGIHAIAYALGDTLSTNEMLEAENPSWDMKKTTMRTGVKARTIASDNLTALDLGFQAASALFENKNTDIKAEDIDGLIFCTQTPDHILPPNSTLLHGRLGLPDTVMAFDISHACSGYTYSLGIASSLVESGTLKNVLVVTGDTYSRLVHRQDRSVRAIFGDGASATIVSSSDNARLNIIDMSFGTSGRRANRFIIENGGSKSPVDINLRVEPDKNARVRSSNHIQMDGLGLLSFFNSVLPVSIKALLEKNALTVSDVDKFVFHQASSLVLDGLRKTMNISENAMVVDMEDTGNLVSTSIPVALANLQRNYTLESGTKILLCGFGVGLSWSQILIQVR